MDYLPLIRPTHAGESCALENIKLSLNSVFQMIVDIVLAVWPWNLTDNLEKQ